MKFEDRSHEENETQERCAQSRAWNLAKNIYKLKENDKTTFYSPAEKWVLRVASTKKPEDREFVVDSRASMHKVSKSDDGDDGQRRGANKRRSDGTCQRIGLIGNSVRIMGVHTTGSAVKNHISSEMARELNAIYQTTVPAKMITYRFFL